MTAEAVDAFARDLRGAEGWQEERERLLAEIAKLRHEVSILHFRLKSPWGRMVTRWKLRHRRHEARAH